MTFSISNLRRSSRKPFRSIYVQTYQPRCQYEILTYVLRTTPCLWPVAPASQSLSFLLLQQKLSPCRVGPFLACEENEQLSAVVGDCDEIPLTLILHALPRLRQVWHLHSQVLYHMSRVQLHHRLLLSLEYESPRQYECICRL
jgi:hypothetical protein